MKASEAKRIAIVNSYKRIFAEIKSRDIAKKKYEFAIEQTKNGETMRPFYAAIEAEAKLGYRGVRTEFRTRYNGQLEKYTYKSVPFKKISDLEKEVLRRDGYEVTSDIIDMTTGEAMYYITW